MILLDQYLMQYRTFAFTGLVSLVEACAVAPEAAAFWLVAVVLPVAPL